MLIKDVALAVRDLLARIETLQIVLWMPLCVPPERLAELGLSTPSELFEKSVFFKPLDPQVENRYTALWENIMAGM